MENLGQAMTNHAKTCQTCLSWVESRDFGNNPACRAGQTIRDQAVERHQNYWKWAETYQISRY